VTDLDAIRERHRPMGIRHVDADLCEFCRFGWPCDAAQLIARVAELEAALSDMLRSHDEPTSGYVLVARITAARALLARLEPVNSQKSGSLLV